MSRRQTDWGHGQNIVAAWPAALLNNKLSLCRHCHPAYGAFDSLVLAISPNILAEVSKEVEKSEIALQYRASMARNHHPFIVGAAGLCLTFLKN